MQNMRHVCTSFAFSMHNFHKIFLSLCFYFFLSLYDIFAYSFTMYFEHACLSAFIYFPIRWSIIRLFQYIFCSSYRKNLWFFVFHKYCNWFNHKWMDPQGNIDIVMEKRVFRLKLHDEKKPVSWTGKFNMCNDCMRRKLLK